MAEPLKIKKSDDRHARTLKIAHECILARAEQLAEYANRYYLDPKKWPDLRTKFEKYQAYMDAVKDIEEMLSNRQGRLGI